MVNNKKKSTIDYNNFGIKISECIHCNHCPGRMSRKSTSIIPKGVGNIFAKNLIILSIWNKNDYKQQLDILKKAYYDIYNKDLIESCYITWAVKCPDYTYADTSIHYCFKLLNNEIKISNFNKILISGHRIYDVYSNFYNLTYIPNCKYIVDVNAILYTFEKDDILLKKGLKEAKLL